MFYDAAGDYRYRYTERLCEYQSIYGGYYLLYVVSVQGKDYACPSNAQEILLLEKGKVIKRIGLERQLEQPGAFCAAVACGKYLLLLPNRYPMLARYDTETGEMRYFTEGLDVFFDETTGERRFGGFCVWKEYLFLASPVNNYVSGIHVPTGKAQLMTTEAVNTCGCGALIPDGEELWLLPYDGYTITRWNPESGEMREYDCRIDGLECRHPVHGYVCDTAPFGRPAITEKYLYLPPCWGDLYLRLDKETGEVCVWEPLRDLEGNKMSCYYSPAGKSATVFGQEQGLLAERRKLFTYSDKKLYDINLCTGEWQEQSLVFQTEDLQKFAVGFERACEWNQYAACEEDAFHTLTDFLQGTLPGKAFDQERANREFAQIAANSDGSCGEKVYTFIRNRLAEM